MLAELVYSKYKKPTKLSDPYDDFSPSLLKKLLEVEEEKFAWNAFSNLLGPHLPAGTYEEVIYFLPRAFEFLKQHEEDALDLVTPVFGFCSKNTENLVADGFLPAVVDEIRNCFEYWVKDFRIEHYDKDMCEAKGWKHDYQDLVWNSQHICEGLSDLENFQTLAKVAVEFMNSLAYHRDDMTRASWFLELSRARDDVVPPSDLIEVQQLLANRDLLNDAYAIVWADARDYKLTYWRDTFKKLAL